jgi:membrane protein DedA with SNARE-associated domain
MEPMAAHAMPAPTPRPRALLAAGLLSAAAFAAFTSGVLPTPDIPGALADLADTLGTWTYLLVAGLAFLETGAFVGLLVPGETAIVLGGVVAAQGEVNVVLIILLAWAAAAVGDLASFALGRRLGRRFLLERGPRLGVTPPRLDRLDGFFDRHGSKAILLGRFIGVVRAVGPFLAGSSGMRLRGFLPWSLVGTAIWTATFTLAGYAFHESFTSASKTLTNGLLGAAALTAVVLAWRAHRRSARTLAS